MLLKEKVAVVTGGAQGIGRALVERFLAEGCRVLVADSDEEAGVRTERELGVRGEIRFIRVDVSREEEIRSLVEAGAGTFGGLDILVNNAAIMVRMPLENLSSEEWERVLAVNLTGPFLCAKHLASELRRRQGVILNIASTRALMSEPDTESYAASKGGLIALTHALALSLGPEVRVNCISPGWIDVSGWRKAGPAGQEILSEEDHRQHPAGRVGTPGDVASLAVFLAGPESGFITGANFVVDGGMTRKMIYV